MTTYDDEMKVLLLGGSMRPIKPQAAQDESEVDDTTSDWSVPSHTARSLAEAILKISAESQSGLGANADAVHFKTRTLALVHKVLTEPFDFDRPGHAPEQE